jgi:putative transposase
LFDAESLAPSVVARSDGELSEVMRCITVTHTRRWHAHRHSSGTGPVYQGRFKSFPVQTDEHFITVARYIERNALRAKLVERGEEWRWSSLFRFHQKETGFLTQWSVERPENWIEFVNAADNAMESDDVRSSAQRGRAFGNEDWVMTIARRLGLESTMKSRGRPKRT